MRRAGGWALVACAAPCVAAAKVVPAPDPIVLGNANAITACALLAIASAGVAGWQLERWVALDGDRRVADWRFRFSVAGVVLTSWALMHSTDGKDDGWGDFALYEKGLVAALMLLALVVGQGLHVGRRSGRSWWLAEGGAVAAVLLVAIASSRDFGGSRATMLAIVGFAILAALVAASLASLRAPIDDAARAHWKRFRVGIVVALLVAIVLPIRLRTLEPRRMDWWYTAVPVGDGSWLAADATPKRLGWPWSLYLLEIGTGRWLRIGPMKLDGCFVDGPDLTVSGDGRVAAWSNLSSREHGRSISACRLDADRRARRLRSARASDWAPILLSPRGTLLAVSAPDGLRIVDVATDRVVRASDTSSRLNDASSALDDDGNLRFVIASRGPKLAMVEVTSHRWLLSDPRPVRVVLSPPEGVEKGDRAKDIQLLPDARIVVGWYQRHRQILALHDADTGRVMAVLSDPEPWRQVMTLADGRILQVISNSDRSVLRVFSEDGALQRTIHLDAGRLMLQSERGVGEVVGCVSASDGARVIVLDVDGGGVADEVAGLTCASDIGGVRGTKPLFRDPLIDDERRSLVLLDWATHARRPAFP